MDGWMHGCIRKERVGEGAQQPIPVNRQNLAVVAVVLNLKIANTAFPAQSHIPQYITVVI